MKQYLTKFSTRAEYTAALENLDFPNVTYLSEDDELVFSQVKPEPETDWSKEYLTFLALEDETFTFTNNAINYSLDEGETWTELAANTPTPTVTAGSKIMFKASITPNLRSGVGSFSSTGTFNAMGNPYSMFAGDNFSGVTDLSNMKSALKNLFQNCTGLTSAENLSLPATILADSCYASMFYGCTSLTTAPELPATTLAQDCYGSMFRGCTSLTETPELPATTLADSCYGSMFDGCTSLTEAPELPATTLVRGCYDYMFKGCTSLTAAPELPATTLAQFCYRNMFRGCTSLTAAPELPATTLVRGCYNIMFAECTSLTTAPELPATTLAQECYNFMFEGCTNVNYVKMLGEAALGGASIAPFTNWLNDAAKTGTVVYSPNINNNLRDSLTSSIPAGWTVETATA